MPPITNTPIEDRGRVQPDANMAMAQTKPPKIAPKKGATMKYRMNLGHTMIARKNRMKKSISPTQSIFLDDLIGDVALPPDVLNFQLMDC